MNSRKRVINRRQFVAQTAQGMGYLAIVASAITASKQLSRAGTASSSTNPFAYDVSAFAKTDPTLIRYEEVGRFASPHPEPRRIAIGPEGRIYIANRNGVDILDRSGGLQQSIKLRMPARCVGVARD